jgi:hypothetical protein
MPRLGGFEMNVQMHDRVVWVKENGDRVMAVVVGHSPDKAWVDVQPVDGSDSEQVRAECVESVED